MILTRAQAAVRSWARKIEVELALAAFDVNLLSGGNALRLNLLVVPRGLRKQGLGSEAMRRLGEYADKKHLRILLDPATASPTEGAAQGTTSRARLVRFYKRFGFVENKGRRKDFSVSAGMIREAR